MIEALRRSAGEPTAFGSTVSGPERAGDGTGPIRRLLLAVLLFGIVGLLLELFLLEHTEVVWQWIPILSLGAAFASGVAVAIRPTRPAVRFFQAVMLLLVCAGLVGLGLHYNSNALFELEIDPSASGLELIRRAMLGATPALAPGAVIELGLLGLIYAYRHPALAGRKTAVAGSAAGAGEPYHQQKEIP